jgi:hypothetical protein
VEHWRRGSNLEQSAGAESDHLGPEVRAKHVLGERSLENQGTVGSDSNCLGAWQEDHDADFPLLSLIGLSQNFKLQDQQTPTRATKVVRTQNT